jgi:hypothetical protein
MIAIVDDLDDHDALLIHLLTMTEPDVDEGHAMALAFVDPVTFPRKSSR